MVRDLRSARVKHTLQVYGWYKKFQDAGWRDKSTKTMEAQEDPGMADSILLPLRPFRERPIFVEHKNGVGTRHERFAFDQWNERQRLFCIACAFSGLPYWLFLMMGDKLNTEDYPLVAYLFEGSKMFEVEKMAGERKSLSYGTAATLFQAEQLVWVPGQDRWEIPMSHPFQSLIRGHHERHYPRYTALRGYSTLRRAQTAAPAQASPYPSLESNEAQFYQAIAFEAAAEFRPG